MNQNPAFSKGVDEYQKTGLLNIKKYYQNNVWVMFFQKIP